MMNSFWWGSKENGKRNIHWFSWNRLCSRKEHGGLGYKDLYNYNIALLGKQGWKLINQPHSLVNKIFKARYFPNDSFLTSKLGSNYSYVWKKSARDVLLQGTRWRLGDGRSVSIWGDAWLPRDGNLRVSSPCPPGMQTLKVQDLLIDDSKVWDRGKILAFFDPPEAQLICNMVLPYSQRQDRLIWHYTNDGFYSAKSGYHVLDASRPPLKEAQGWKSLWKLQLPPKIKMLLWKIGTLSLPTRWRLQGKHMQIPSTCLFCPNEVEHDYHLFGHCPYARHCWNVAAIPPPPATFAELGDWILQTVIQGSTETSIKIVGVIWAIWHQRNNHLWNAKRDPAPNAVCSALKFITNWQEANSHHRRPTVNCTHENVIANCHWRRPEPGFLKCNVDASIFTADNYCGYGAIIRTCDGSVAAIHSANYQKRQRQLRECIVWLNQLHCTHVIIESNAKLIVDSVQSARTNLSEYGEIIKDCRNMLATKPNFTVSFVPRLANKAAHSIARNALVSPSTFVMFNLPSWFEDVVCTDAANSAVY